MPIIIQNEIYQLIDLSADVKDYDKFNKARRKVLADFHPDRNKNLSVEKKAVAEEKFKRISGLANNIQDQASLDKYLASLRFAQNVTLIADETPEEVKKYIKIYQNLKKPDRDELFTNLLKHFESYVTTPSSYISIYRGLVILYQNVYYTEAYAEAENKRKNFLKKFKDVITKNSFRANFFKSEKDSELLFKFLSAEDLIEIFFASDRAMDATEFRNLFQMRTQGSITKAIRSPENNKSLALTQGEAGNAPRRKITSAIANIFRKDSDALVKDETVAKFSGQNNALLDTDLLEWVFKAIEASDPQKGVEVSNILLKKGIFFKTPFFIGKFKKNCTVFNDLDAFKQFYTSYLSEDIRSDVFKTYELEKVVLKLIGNSANPFDAFKKLVSFLNDDSRKTLLSSLSRETVSRYIVRIDQDDTESCVKSFFENCIPDNVPNVFESVEWKAVILNLISKSADAFISFACFLSDDDCRLFLSSLLPETFNEFINIDEYGVESLKDMFNKKFAIVFNALKLQETIAERVNNFDELIENLMPLSLAQRAAVCESLINIGKTEPCITSMPGNLEKLRHLLDENTFKKLESLTSVKDGTVIATAVNHVSRTVQDSQEIETLLPQGQENSVISNSAGPSNVEISVKSCAQTTSASISVSSNSASFFNLSLKEKQNGNINNLITQLEKEIRSYWPYPNKTRKIQKVNALKELLNKDSKDSHELIETINNLEKAFPEIRKGWISTRTADLLDKLKDNNKASNPERFSK